VNDGDRTLVHFDDPGNSSNGRLWRYDDGPAVAEPADVPGGLVSLGFITAALGRRKRLWCTTAVAGLLLGCGYYVMSPAAYQASTSILLTTGPYEDVTTAAANDEALAETPSVAGLAVRELGLHESPGNFLSAYKAVALTERLMTITATAKTSSEAVSYANAVATAFLSFRSQELQTQQNLVLSSLNQQVNQAQRRFNSLNAQIGQLSDNGPLSASQAKELKNLQTEQTRASSNLYDLQQDALGSQATDGSATAAAIRGSVVLDTASPLAHSRLKPLAFAVVLGLMAGLALGVAIVVVAAIVSDRLRRRDDVARALGTPVRLSVGAIRPRRWLPSRVGSAGRAAAVHRIVGYLDRTLPKKTEGVAALAVVPVDDPRAAARCLYALAISCAKAGKQVVVADLCRGAPAARLLGTKETGIHRVDVQGAGIVVAVPDRDDLVPHGPLDSESTAGQRSSFTEAVVSACDSANVLLTLAALDPALGGDHLATWATDAVVMVTAGQSSWTKIQATGEMVRLAGTRLVSAVLVGADRTDESLGVIRLPETV
jgi:capsular polysaccharide biosynthesis protein